MSLRNLLHECTLHDQTTCDADLVASISSVPNCRSGRQEWLFSGPNVCLVTLALLEPIVTQNMCFYGPMLTLLMSSILRLPSGRG